MISYGYKVTSEKDPLVRIAEEAMLGFAKASEPGAFLVDRFPFCKFLESSCASIAESLKFIARSYSEAPAELVPGCRIPAYREEYERRP